MESWYYFPTPITSEYLALVLFVPLVKFRKVILKGKIVYFMTWEIADVLITLYLRNCNSNNFKSPF